MYTAVFTLAWMKLNDMRTDKGFFIFRNKTFQNKFRLDLVGRILYNWFYLYLNHSPSLSFTSEIQEIYVTSQYRHGKYTRHSTGKAIDFTISPIYLMPVFWIILHSYFKFNLFLSVHNMHYDPALKHYRHYPGRRNRHIHCDAAFTGLWPPTRNYKNKKYIETRHPKKAGWIELGWSHTGDLQNIYTHYNIIQKSVKDFIAMYHNQYIPQSKKIYLTPSATGNILYEETKKATQEIITDFKNIPMYLPNWDQVQFFISAITILGGVYITKEILK